MKDKIIEIFTYYDMLGARTSNKPMFRKWCSYSAIFKLVRLGEQDCAED